MRAFFLSISCFFFVFGMAQDAAFDTLKTSAFSVLVSSNGQLFHNGGDDSLCLFHGGGEFYRRAGLWMVASENDQIYKSGDHHRQKEANFTFGPIDTIVGILPDDGKNYNRVWKVTKTQVDYHKNHWNNVGYTPSKSIKEWPVHIEGDFDQFNAAFVDWNQNGIYDPENGDYPFINGDEEIYFLANDAQSEGNSIDGFSFKVEVRGKVWTQKNHPELLFFEYAVFNRNNSLQFDNVTASFYVDGTMGEYDNYATTDIHRNSVILYNESGDSAFKNGQPAGAVILFGKKISSSMILSGQGSKNSLPKNALEFNAVTSGKWADDSELTYGGVGHGTGSITKYSFSGSTENSLDPWLEDDYRSAGRRQLILSVDGQSVIDDNPLVLKGAILMSIGKSINDIKADISSVKQSLEVRSEVEKVAIKIYPNPTHDKVNIDSEGVGINHVEIADIYGRVVYRNKFYRSISISCNNLGTNGVYKVRVQNDRDVILKTLSLMN